ncbi:MAG: S8 family serine peptidase [Raoultibacter sp.]
MSRFKKHLALALSFLLAAMLLPAGLSVAVADEPQDSSSLSWSEAIPTMLTAGNYDEGEALVIVAENSDGASGRGRSIDLLSGAAPLMEVTTEAYSTGVADSQAGVAPAAPAAAFSRAPSAQPTLAIKLVQQSGMSTEQLLYELAQDPRVLRAEPNYSYKVSDEASGQDAKQPAETLPGASDKTGQEPQANAPSSDAPTSLPAADQKNAEGTAENASVPALPEALAPTNTPFTLEGGTQDVSGQMSDLTGYEWAFENSSASSVMTGLARRDGFTVNLPDWNKPAISNSDAVVAVMDSGIDYNHPDLRGVMANMSPYADLGFGPFGANVVTKGGYPDKRDPMDDNSHGSHVAGIIASEWNNFGTSGVANGVKLVAMKAVQASGSVYIANVLDGYGMLSGAVDRGLDLVAVNNSWGGIGTSAMMSTAVAELGKKGVVSVFASGNESANIDIVANSSGSFINNPYAVVVNSSTMAAERSSFSNFGVATTEVFAPGSKILSTIPTTLGTYLPLSSQGTLAYEGFESKDKTPSISIHKTDSYDIPANSAVGVHNDAVHFDKAGSWMLKSDDLYKGEGDYTVTLKVPIDKNAVGQGMHRVGMNIFSPKQSFFLGILPEGPGGKQYFDISQSKSVEAGWNSVSLDVDKMLANMHGKELVYHNDGNGDYVSIALSFGPVEPLEKSFELYFDNISIGNQTVGYEFMNGTSMATPLVTGAAAVQATRIKQAASAPQSKAERARLLAATLKGSVVSYDAFKGFCTSGGHVSLDPQAAMTPVINSAQVSGGVGSARIALSGFFFGPAPGSVSIAGVQAPVESWSENEVVVQCPSQIKAGVHEIQLAASNTQTSRKTLALDIPPDPSKDMTLFEDTITLPHKGFAEKSQGNKMIGLGGNIYVMPGATDFDDASIAMYGDMWKYDPAARVWAQVAGMPVRLQALSATLYEGKLLVLGRSGDNLEKSHLFSYDPRSDVWTNIEGIEGIPIGAALVNNAGDLMLVGGQTYEPNPVDPNLGIPVMMEKDNIALFDLPTRTVTPVGTLAVPRMSWMSVLNGDVKITAHGGAVYLAGGFSVLNEAQGKPVAEAERLVKTEQGGYQASVIDNLMPKPATGLGYRSDYGLTSAKVGPVIAGVKALATTGGAKANAAGSLANEDSYVLDVAQAGSAFKGLGKRVSYSPLEQPSALAYEGRLYVMGGAMYEPDLLVMRSTPLETLPQPGDLVAPVNPVNPDPGKPSGKLVATGDRGGLLLALGMVGACVALIAAGVASRRLKKFSEN